MLLNRDELKKVYSMKAIIKMYGLELNNSDYISCPYHTNVHLPTMKIYEDHFHCHECKAHGDIFNFVQKMENCSFSEAIRILNDKHENKNEKQESGSFRERLEKYKEKKNHETTVAREKRYERERKARDDRLYKLYLATYGACNDAI